MAENEQQESTPTIVVVNDVPTTKQQLTAAGIQLGTALAIPVLLAGGYYAAAVADKIKTKIKEAKRSRQTKLTVVKDTDAPAED